MALSRLCNFPLETTEQTSHIQRALPWLGPVFTIASIAALCLGSLALVANHYSLPYIGNHLQFLSFKQSASLAIGGAVGIIVAGVVKYLRDRKIRPDAYTKVPKAPQFKNKIYYSTLTGCFYASKKFLNKNNLISIKKLTNGAIHIKTPQKVGEGADKQVFLGYNPKDKEPASQVVRTVERSPRKNLEDTIYEITKEHPNFIHCLGRLKNTPEKKVLLLEYCNQGTVKEKLDPSSNERDKVDIKALFIDYFNALDFLHKKGFLHMDLHEGNLFIHQTDTPTEIEGLKELRLQGKLGDFGTSKKMSYFKDEIGEFKADEDGNLEAPICCKLIAPEILFNMAAFREKKECREIDGKADVWALGFTLASLIRENHKGYQAVLKAQDEYRGKKNKFAPFVFPVGDNVKYASKLRSHVEKISNTYPKEAPPLPLDKLIWEMLDPNPERRPTAKQVAERLAAITF